MKDLRKCRAVPYTTDGSYQAGSEEGSTGLVVWPCLPLKLRAQALFKQSVCLPSAWGRHRVDDCWCGLRQESRAEMLAAAGLQLRRPSSTFVWLKRRRSRIKNLSGILKTNSSSLWFSIPPLHRILSYCNHMLLQTSPNLLKSVKNLQKLKMFGQ